MTKKILLIALLILGCMVAIPPLSANAAACTQNSYKQCISNIVYWYDSCGAVQSVAQNCNTTGQICQNAQCVYPAGTPQTPQQPQNPTYPTTPTNPGQPNNTNHASKACYNNNLHWYNQQGMVQELFQSCADNNSCTQDSCGINQCVNTLKCDGSTCAANSADYAMHCQTAQNPGPQNPGTQNPGQQIGSAGLMVATFVQKEAEGLTWQKTLSTNTNEKLTFLVVVKNGTSVTLNSVTLKTDLTASISYTGGLKINNTDATGNLGAGIGVGTLAPKESKIIVFNGTTQTASAMPTVTINSTVTAENNIQDSDTLTVTLPTAQNNNQTDTEGDWDWWSMLVGFLQRWWVWILITIILAILFVIIFRRLSSSI